MVCEMIVLPKTVVSAVQIQVYELTGANADRHSCKLSHLGSWAGDLRLTAGLDNDLSACWALKRWKKKEQRTGIPTSLEH